jgi:hypothetical protein
MSRSTQIANRFREVTLNGKWIANTNYMDQLAGSDWKMATTKIHELNTVAILTQHVNYYIAGLKQVFEGGTLDIKDKFSFDFPPVQSQGEWDRIVAKFKSDAERFAELVEDMSDSTLSAAFVDEKYGSYSRNIEAMIEHAYYHLGQLVLVKKMILQNG